MPAAAGHNATLSYDLEGSFNGTAAGSPTPFGADAQLSTFELGNNPERHYQPGSRQADHMTEGQFDGSFSVEFTLTNPHWLDIAVAEATTDVDNNYEYSGGEVPSSCQIIQGVEGSHERTLSGCVVTSATISASTDESVTITLDGAYADESSSGTITSQPTISNRAMKAHNAVFNVGGTTLSLTQNVEISIENNTDLVYELGSRFAADWSPKQRETSIDYGRIVQDDSDVDRVYGSGTSPQAAIQNEADASLQCTNPSGDEINFNVTGLFPESLSVDGVGDVEAELESNMTEWAATVNAFASSTF